MVNTLSSAQVKLKRSRYGLVGRSALQKPKEPKSLEKGFPLRREPSGPSRADKCRLLLRAVPTIACMFAKCHYQIESGEQERERDTGGGRAIFVFYFSKPKIKNEIS